MRYAPRCMKTFLAGLVVDGRRCVVLGGDREALDKSRRLAAAGAALTVVSPTLDPGFDALAGRHPFVHIARAPDLARDLTPVPFLVVSTALDPARSEALYAQALSERFLLCCIDQPACCTFSNLAVAEVGVVSLGLGSNGAAPALLRRLRDDLAAGLGDGVADFSRYLADLRVATAPEARRAVLAEALGAFSVGVQVRLPDGWRDRWEALRGQRPPADGLP
jgi:precorrin-2 dehydrogenase/sirohydrochlorin ferrochelatase